MRGTRDGSGHDARAIIISDHHRRRRRRQQQQTSGSCNSVYASSSSPTKLSGAPTRSRRIIFIFVYSTPPFSVRSLTRTGGHGVAAPPAVAAAAAADPNSTLVDRVGLFPLSRKSRNVPIDSATNIYFPLTFY